MPPKRKLADMVADAKAQANVPLKNRKSFAMTNSDELVPLSMLAWSFAS
jgi:hypothetical protein